jgi:acyl carrier protein
VDRYESKLLIEFSVKESIMSRFSIPLRDVNSNSRLVEDLKFDSVDIVEIAMMMDEVFNVELSLDQVAAWRSMADIVNSVADCNACCI